MSEPRLSGAVEDLDLRLRGSQPVGDLAGAVGRVVVNDQNPVRIRSHALELGCGRTHDAIDVRCLVVGGDNDPDRWVHRAGA